MALLDLDEYGRWAATAARNLEMARLLAREGHADGAVFHAEMAAHCALKALLHAVGRTSRARGHGLLALADAAQMDAALQLDGGLREELGSLASDYLTSRYPDALASGTPAEHYGAIAAERAIGTAEAVTSAVERARAALATASDEDAPSGGSA